MIMKDKQRAHYLSRGDVREHARSPTGSACLRKAQSKIDRINAIYRIVIAPLHVHCSRFLVFFSKRQTSTDREKLRP